MASIQDQRAHSSLAFQNVAAQGDSTGGTKIVNKSNDPSNMSGGPHFTGLPQTQQHHSTSQDFREQRHHIIAEEPVLVREGGLKAHRSSRTKMNEQRSSNRASQFRDKKGGNSKASLGASDHAKLNSDKNRTAGHGDSYKPDK